MKEYFDILKQLWKNPKTHALMVLSLWFIFIGIVVVFFNFYNNIDSNKTNISTTSSDFSDTLDFSNMKSYEFSYKAGSISLNGIFYENKYLLYLNNERFYKNENLYKIDKAITKVKEPDLLKIDSVFIYKLIRNKEPISNRDYKTYLIPLTEFLQSYESETPINKDLSSYNIIINVYKNEVNIDLENYYKLKQKNVENSILNIKYYNINKISDFTKEYDLMIGVK